jgi:hypothetical protein
MAWASVKAQGQLYLYLYLKPLLVTKMAEDIHKLKVFENRVLRRIFLPKREEVTGSWRKLQRDIMRATFLLFNCCIVRRPNQGSGWDMGHSWEGEINSNKILFGKPKRKSPIGRSRRRREDNIKRIFRVQGMRLLSGFM